MMQPNDLSVWLRRLIPCLAGLVVLASLAAGQAEVELIDAVKQNDLQTVRLLLARHPNLNASENDGSTALDWAAQQDNLEITDLLIAAGADPKASTRYHITPLWFACKNGDAALIEHLLKAGAEVNETEEEGQMPLMTAALTGKTGAIRVLLTSGAKVNATEPYKGETALMWAAAEGNAAAEDMLIEFGADVKATSKGGFTALLFAVRNGSKDAVDVLLRHGANPNDVAPDHTSALNLAVVNANFEIAALLLEKGADPNAPDPRGSALHTIAWLRKPGSDGAVSDGGTPYAPPAPTGKMTGLELAKFLLEHGANPNIRINWKEVTFNKDRGSTRNPPNIHLGRHLLSYIGATPFYIAAKNGDAEYMKLLADHGADPKIPTRAGITPLMAAAGLDYWQGESPGPFTGVSEAERLEAVKLALALGNDINAHADFGNYPMVGDPAYTLLYYPLNMDDLLDLGVGDPRWSGATPLIAAVVSGQPSIVQFLIENGADLNAKTKLGWTPLMVAGGVFFANAKKEFPQAAALLRKALAQRGLSASNSRSHNH